MIERDIFYIKKRKLWVIKPFGRAKHEMIAWVTGSRAAKTFKRLYAKVKHLKGCTFDTDFWNAFSKVFPPKRHVIGKRHTVAIERDNSNIRNDLARFTCLTKVISKSEKMVNNTLKFWQALRSSSLFFDLQTALLPVLE